MFLFISDVKCRYDYYEYELIDILLKHIFISIKQIDQFYLFQYCLDRSPKSIEY